MLQISSHDAELRAPDEAGQADGASKREVVRAMISMNVNANEAQRRRGAAVSPAGAGSAHEVSLLVTAGTPFVATSAHSA